MLNKAGSATPADLPGMVERDQIATFLEALFGATETDGVICVRGIGEKGTPQEGFFRENTFIDTADSDLVGRVERIARRYAEHSIGTFIVPAVLDKSATVDGATEKTVSAFGTVCIDLDNEDPAGTLGRISYALGQPSLTVMSGGETVRKLPKLHAYWRLSEEVTDPVRLGLVREELARKAGGDPCMGRSTQVIRVPGTVYAKNGAPKLCQIMESFDNRVCHFDDLEEKILTMQPFPGREKSYEKWKSGEAVEASLKIPGGGGFDFSKFAGKNETDTTTEAMTVPVHEGGTEDRNRWTEFGRVAGHYIHCNAIGRMTLEEAEQKTRGWMVSHMVPPWPEKRFRQEWSRLVRIDRRNHGEPVSAGAAAGQQQPLSSSSPGALQLPQPGSPFGSAPPIQRASDLFDRAARNISTEEPPPRKFLVEGYLPAGKMSILAAEGGAGKTNSVMELCLKLASAGQGVKGLTWMGQPIPPESFRSESGQGKTAVLITAEDSEDELDVRWAAMDPGMTFRKIAGNHLVTLCLDNLGGSFPFVAADRGRATGFHPNWIGIMNALRELHASGSEIGLVVIDTLSATLHGDENSSLVINEYLSCFAELRSDPRDGGMGAGVLITHHLKKPGREPVRTLSDMRGAVRGSNAIQNGVRCVLGLWHCVDWFSRMKRMDIEPEEYMLYFLGVVKANFPHPRKPRTVLRQNDGTFKDVTQGDTSRLKYADEPLAWLELAIMRAEALDVPFTRRGDRGAFNRRTELPEALHGYSRREVNAMVEMLENRGRIISSDLMAGKGATGLGVPGGKISKGQGVRNPGDIFSVDPEPYRGWGWAPEAGQLIRSR